ncbi:MAG: hypothetical protein AB8G15_11190 [Saprospiraceae bacterium]
MKHFLLLLFFSCCCQWIQAAINPVYKHCMQRGYAVDGDYCVFPDSTRCLLTAFNEQRCGEQWFIEDYCIPLGAYVWDADKCCEGLVAYLPEGVSGQATCRKRASIVAPQNFAGPSLWIIAGTIIFLLVLLFILRKGPNRRIS